VYTVIDRTLTERRDRRRFSARAVEQTGIK
jgi:hypothetical protein